MSGVGDLVKMQILFIRAGWGRRLCICNQLLGEADAVDQLGQHEIATHFQTETR